MRIAIVDYLIKATNPIGGAHRRMLAGLSQDHEFTVFAVEFDNPNPQRIRWVRIPAPKRPLIVLFLVFHFLAPLFVFREILRDRTRFDVVQSVESNFLFSGIIYAQFCHRFYLKTYFRKNVRLSVRSMALFVDHALHGLLEPLVYRTSRYVVVPSRGLANELEAEYPYLEKKLRIVPNAVDVDRLMPPIDFERDEYRKRMGMQPDDFLMVFIALGHFERKGLPLLLEAIKCLKRPEAKLIVVGGNHDLIQEYARTAQSFGISGSVYFAGMQESIRPFLWASDAFVFPSSYETFSLVTFEAAAAGLPIVVTPLHGVEDLIRHGENGLIISPTVEGVTQGLTRLLSMTPNERNAMGQSALHSVHDYDQYRFVENWRKVYSEIAVK